ncbi:putative polyketide synthase protein [Aspergillus ustus]|uniref:Putative polyketide synthase protein n=1 Tax=Aspergillus ustus TaxID=40382 RepID=A0A0C1C3Q4_ASPUT|nr:putative polyketide synthase protein [Aspergillus ustus]
MDGSTGSLDSTQADAEGVMPIVVVSFACRLPGGNNDPETLWRFLERGQTAPNTVPKSRFSSRGHYDGSKRSKTMKGRGGMFLENVDLAGFDAPFFNISAVEARSMDPQQRQLLEVVYEGLENGGLTLDGVSGQQVGCFVSSFTVDYLVMQNRDPDARPIHMTTGTKRSILSNRISHYFNLKGPSVTVDTACSGGLSVVDLACRYLGSNDISAAVVAASHLFLNPDDLLEDGQHGSVYSPDGLCQVFDTKANGYVKAEAVNCVILKRLDDALSDGDPIRAIIRGSASNSNGATVGISTPSKEQQAACIRAAYARAGITDTNATSYIECHGTGTQAGDPIEVSALSTVFGPTRDTAGPLIIGSVKGNLGHSEPAAGLSGVIKAVLAMEKGKIPGQTNLSELNPKIDLNAGKLHIPKRIMDWPEVSIRRASVNSFGFGGANAHLILEEPKGSLGMGWSKTHVVSRGPRMQMGTAAASKKLYTMVFSAAAEESLKAYYTRIKRHLADMNVKVRPADLAYTLSQRRTHHSCRAYAVTSASNLNRAKVEFGEKGIEPPRVAFVFTGQGSQWPQMGAGLINAFPCAAKRLRYLDTVLQGTAHPPSWSLIGELSEPREPEYYQRPELSQPLTTALQLAILSILEEWGVRAEAVVGHSSGEIAAAYAAGYLSVEQAMLAAFYRGQAAATVGPSADEPLGMLAVGAGADKVKELLPELQTEGIQIACINSPNSVTLSGPKSALTRSQVQLEQQGCFARMLRVDLAYHSSYVADIAELYKTQLDADWFKYPATESSRTIEMFSSVTGRILDQPCDAEYWRVNMTSPVLFSDAAAELLKGLRANLLLEIGPSGALAGPIRQILDAVGSGAKSVQYLPALKRAKDAAEAMHELAGKLYIADYPLSLHAVNFPTGEDATTMEPAVIVDLPNYSWDHSTEYWHESEASRDWRFGQHPYHELVGRKVLGTPWAAPSWKATIRLDDLAWLKDHRMAGDPVFPAAGYLAMAIEGIFQARQSVNPLPDVESVSELQYVLRDVRFKRALALDGGRDTTVMLVFTDVSEGYTSWTGFRVLTVQDGSSVTHCDGSIRICQSPARAADEGMLAPLRHSESAEHWYRALDRRGCTYGPDFQRLIDIECLAGQRESRATISLEPPSSGTQPHMYCLHPALIDICFQSVFPAIYGGLRSEIKSLLLPSSLDELTVGPTINASSDDPAALSIARAAYTGSGPRHLGHNQCANASVWSTKTSHLLLEFKGLHFSELNMDDGANADPELFVPVWLPDLEFLSQDQILSLLRPEAAVSDLIDLVAFKKPRLRVGEINLTSGADTASSAWFGDGSSSDNKGLRDAYEHCTYVDADPARLTAVRGLVGDTPNAEFKLLGGKDTSSIITDPKSPDLVIVQHQDLFSPARLPLLERVRNPEGQGQPWYLFVQHSTPTTACAEDIDTAALERAGFEVLFKVPISESEFMHLCRNQRPPPAAVPQTNAPVISIISAQSKSALQDSLTASLTEAGYQVELQASLTPSNTGSDLKAVVVLDDFASPLLADVNDEQWEKIRELLLHHGPVKLWVTQGAQFGAATTNPNNALIHGLSRSIRAENPAVKLVTLDIDIDIGGGDQTITATPTNNDCVRIVQLLGRIVSSRDSIPPPVEDCEFVERGGVLHVSRVLKKSDCEELLDRERGAAEVARTEATQAMQDNANHVRLGVTHVGSLDSLQLYEVPGPEPPLLPDQVEIEVSATGLNFKDVAVSTGLVPGEDHALGLDAAGVVTKVGRHVHSFRAGDRVAFMDKGAFTNRARISYKRVHHVPDGMGLEVAAALPLVFMTAIYALVDTARLRRGQSVLIHSGAGGVGIAAIQLAQHLQADIYVTVGSADKRVFLQEQLNIPANRIFSSRNSDFAQGILAATKGRGVDVILNSVTGELLDETWRICADGGMMVDIGRGLRNQRLAAGPFERNCSVKAFDLGHSQISDDVIQSLIAHAFDLFRKQHLQVVHPIRVFPYAEVRDAFDYLSTGSHIGKIVVSDGPGDGDGDTMVPSAVSIRSAPTASVVRSDKAYLITGGLNGIGGTLAIYLALRGAQSIVVLSRSGCSTSRAEWMVENCRRLGCEIQVAKGDVTSYESVKSALTQASLPVCGIIHGAMVLHDKPYEMMDASSYRKCIAPKVQGAWNLHHAAAELKLQLDFFTLLSSISGVIGQNGQANYAAANCFLDSFASYRRSLGQPALSLDLGAVQDIGVAMENPELLKYFSDPQWLPIEQGELFYIMDASIQHQHGTSSSAQLIMALAYPIPPQSELLNDIRFSSLSHTGSSSSSGQNRSQDAATVESQAVNDFLCMQRTPDANATVLTEAAIELFQAQLLRMLRLDGPIKANKPLSAYGMDSLSAVKLRNWVERSFQVTFAVFEILGANGLQALCSKLITRLQVTA